MADDQLEQWIDAGLLSREQTNALAKFSASAMRPTPDPVSVPERRRGLVAEVIGYCPQPARYVRSQICAP